MFKINEMMTDNYEEHLQYLKDQIAITNLKSITDDKFLLRFLRAKKFDQKRAFNLLKSYYSVRIRYNQIFSNFVPSSAQEVLHSGIFEVLPLSDQLGRKILIGKVECWNIYKHSIVDLLRAMLMILETALKEEEVQMNGIVIVYDCRGFTWRHAIQFTPRMIYLIKILLENAFPLLYKEIHIINMNGLVRNVINISKPILSMKMRKRLHVHGNSMEGLHSFISEDVLPKEYGGKLTDNNLKIFMDKVLEMEKEFNFHQKYWNECG